LAIPDYTLNGKVVIVGSGANNLDGVISRRFAIAVTAVGLGLGADYPIANCCLVERTSMRTVLFLVAGVLFLGALLLLGRLFSTNYPSATLAATIVYVVVWFVIAGANMWVGIVRAGYSVTEELPIFLLIFGLPAAIAIFLKWKIL
jgi:hypothetical protein